MAIAYFPPMIFLPFLISFISVKMAQSALFLLPRADPADISQVREGQDREQPLIKPGLLRSEGLSRDCQQRRRLAGRRRGAIVMQTSSLSSIANLMIISVTGFRGCGKFCGGVYTE